MSSNKDLDTRLREIVAQVWGFAYADGQLGQHPEKDDISEAVAHIKTAFKEAGYHKECPPKITDGKMYPLVWAKANGYKTGAEWYERFKQTCDGCIMVGDPKTAALMVAKRASGVEETPRRMQDDMWPEQKE